MCRKRTPSSRRISGSSDTPAAAPPAPPSSGEQNITARSLLVLVPPEIRLSFRSQKKQTKKNKKKTHQRRSSRNRALLTQPWRRVPRVGRSVSPTCAHETGKQFRGAGLRVCGLPNPDPKSAAEARRRGARRAFRAKLGHGLRAGGLGGYAAHPATNVFSFGLGAGP